MTTSPLPLRPARPADPTSVLRPLLVDTAVRLQSALSEPFTVGRDPLHTAVLDLLDSLDQPTRRVGAALYAARSRPGVGDHLADCLDEVQSRESDRLRGYRLDDDGVHDGGPCQRDRGYPDCTLCDERYDALLDDAVRELLYTLGESGVADLLDAVQA